VSSCGRSRSHDAAPVLLCSADTFQNKLDSHRACKRGGIARVLPEQAGLGPGEKGAAEIR